MKVNSLIAALCTLAATTGCATKNNSHSSFDPNKTAFISETPENNPIILQEELEAPAQERAPSFDIPVTRNAKVEQWLAYFQGKGRKWFRVWLERSGRYIPPMRKILRDHDLPEDLVYLAMIESGFSPKAYSRARAVGPWQFIKSTGRLYGLKSNFWLDERRDPEKSTIAAARHLKDLYDQFQSWKLAAAAYNAGARKVSNAIRRYKTEDFWELTKGRYLRAETKHYVPKIIAAALIAKEPEKYGFADIQYQDPLEYDKIIVPEPVNLVFLAKKAGIEIAELMAINPELNHTVTPPDVKNYELRIPARTSQQFLVALNSLEESEKFQYASHTVKRGDTLYGISRGFGVPVSEIMELNKLRSSKYLKVGQTLLIPIPAGVKWAGKRSTQTASVSPRKTSKPQISKKLDSKVHVVRRGESLWSIAQRYGVTITDIKQENGIHKNFIYPGKRLYIPL